MTTTDPSTQARIAGRLRKHRWLLVAVVISAFLTLGGPARIKYKLVEQRCINACDTYMRGMPGARWVAEFANGPGYSALLTCTSEAMHRQVGLDCWKARVDACGTACAASNPPLFSRENRGSWR